MSDAYSIKLSELTEKQREYVGYRMEGFNPHQAGKKAGFNKSYWVDLERSPTIQPLLAAYFREQQEAHAVTLNDVVKGIKEGIELCTLQADGVGVIGGWEKLARICGIAAAEKKEISITHEGQVAQLHYEALDEQKLLELVGKQRQLVLEGEFEEVASA
jgi:phage terminase small subunit